MNAGACSTWQPLLRSVHVKIAIVSVRGPTLKNRRGGAQDYIRGIAAAWVQLGHATEILCGQEWVDGEWLPDREWVDGIEVVRVGTPKQRALPLSRAARAKAGECDAIVENIMGFPLLLPWQLPRSTPLVAIKHHFQEGTFIGAHGWLKGSWGIFCESGIMPWVYRNVPLIANSEQTRQSLQRQWIRPRREVSVVPPGLNFSPQQLPKFSEPTICYVGALHLARKKIDDLLAAFRQVQEIWPRSRLILAGDGPDRARVETLATGLNVELRGFVSDREKFELYERSWVFASPSLKEGFGITWVEANAFGLPVVGYDLGLDTVNDSCACMVPVGDVPALAEALIALLGDPDRREQMSVAARLNAQRFDWHTSAKRLLAVIEKVKKQVNESQFEVKNGSH